ncbi:MAG: ABC transporter ATP-binding protein [Pseudomonadota bacterium]
MSAIANAIEISGLEKTYAATKDQPAKTALHGIDLTIPAGSIFGLLGPNGAGKSTCINILAGLVTKSAGAVRIWGFDQDVNPRQSRAAIGVVPQELNLDPFFTPYAALETQAGLYGVPKRQRRSMEILGRVGLGDKAYAYPRSLSGGMRRRLLVAKAMVHNPHVLVLDEPTAGVDIELRRMLWDYVRELNDAGTTVILTTHYLEEAEAMCDRIAIIDHGRITAHEDTATMLARLDSKTLVLTCARLPAALPNFGAGVAVEDRGQGRLALTFTRRETSAPALMAAAAEAELEITDIATEEPHLEEVFLALTGRAASERAAATTPDEDAA